MMKELLNPLKADSLRDIFTERFEEAILSGKLRVGQALPSERELAQQLGVSRPVVHQGLMDLEFRGLVKLTPRVGAVVSDYRTEGSLPLLTSLFNYHRGGVEPKLLDSLLDVRQVFEVHVAGLAAENRTDDHVATLNDIVARERKADPSAAEQIAELDFTFHHLVAMASGNLVYPLLLNSLKPIYTNLTEQFFADPQMIPPVLSAHAKLAESIDRKDAGDAVRTMKALLAHGEAHLKRLIDNRPGQTQSENTP